jgi:hypothetical protein
MAQLEKYNTAKAKYDELKRNYESIRQQTEEELKGF